MQETCGEVCVVERKEFGVQLLFLNSARQHHRTFWIELGAATGSCAQARKRLATSTARCAASHQGKCEAAVDESRILSLDIRFPECSSVFEKLPLRLDAALHPPFSARLPALQASARLRRG